MLKVSKKIKFKCEACGRSFQKFSGLSNHSSNCEIAIRKNKEHTEEATLAHRLWCVSFKDTKRKNFEYDLFINHRDYNLFTNLAAFCLKLKVLDSEKYMDWCIKERLKIKLWTNELVYDKFIKHYLVHEDPVDAVIRSISYIKDLKINDYFNTVQPGTFLTSLEMGRISPWLYLLYSRSNDILKRMNQDHINRLNLLIDSSIWSMLKKRHKDICEEIKKTIRKEVL